MKKWRIRNRKLKKKENEESEIQKKYKKKMTERGIGYVNFKKKVFQKMPFLAVHKWFLEFQEKKSKIQNPFKINSYKCKFLPQEW